MELQGMDYFMADPSRMDSLTSDQIMALSRGEEIEYGDTAKAEGGESPDSTGKTDAELATEAAAQATLDAAAQAEAAKKPVVLAKDGVHTIPYEQLQEARDRAAQLESFSKQQGELIAQLQAAKVIDDANGKGGTQAQEAVLAEYAGEFPEVFNDLKPIIESMVKNGVEANMKAFATQLKAEIAPMQQMARDNAQDTHFNSITAAIPDFDQLVESGAIDDYVKTLPSYAQAGALKVLYGIKDVPNSAGTATQVIELFNAYKQAEGIQPVKTAPSLTAQQLKDKAAAIITGVKAKPPKSLTDVPSGTIEPTDDLAAEAGMSAMGLLAKFEKMNPSDILKHAGRQI